MKNTFNPVMSQFKILGRLLLCLTVIAGFVACGGGGGGHHGGGSGEYSLTGYSGGNTSDTENPYDLYTEFPWWVNVTFQVSTPNCEGVSGLTKDDFILTEDGVELSVSDSEPDIRQRDSLPSGYEYTLDTVLLLDNTPSQTGNLDLIKEAAHALIDEWDEKRQQRVAIVAFDDTGDPFVKQDFTDNRSELNECLITGEAARQNENALQPSTGSTNFYGAVIEALSLWEDDLSPYLPDSDNCEEDDGCLDKSFRQGVLVVITDGKDTAGVKDLTDAIDARGRKQVYTVAVDANNLSENVKQDLDKLGNAIGTENGYFPVPNNNNLNTTLQEIQNQILCFADGFYWIKYKSSTRSTDPNTNHQVTLAIKGNSNSGEDAQIHGEFSSSGFVADQGGVVLNASAADPDGINGINSPSPDVIELSFDPYSADNLKFSLKAETIKENKNPQQYSWLSSNPDVVAVEPDASATELAEIAPKGIGTAQVTVIDVNNENLEQTVRVRVDEGGVYLNASESDPDGLNGIDSEEPDTIGLAFDPINDLDEETYEINATTFGDNSAEPEYEWMSMDPSVVTVEAAGNNTAKGIVTAKGIGRTRIVVHDKVNNQEVSVLVDVGGIYGGFRFLPPESVEPVYPWFVNAMFHVKDIYDREVTTLALENGDFIIKETSEQTNETTEIGDQTERHIWKHDNMPSDFTYTFKTVLLLDKTPSVGQANFEEIKLAAQKMVDEAYSGSIKSAEGDYQQEIGVWAFTDSVEQVIDFSDDPKAIKTAIEGIQPVSPTSVTTDLYGAAIEATSFYENNFQVADNNAIVEGAVVLVTDGFDTTGLMNDFEDALQARNSTNKQFVTVGIGSSVYADQDARNQLEELGNLDYFLISDPGAQVADKQDENYGITLLEDTFLSVQERLEDYAGSFYWLEYKSSTPGTKDPTWFELRIEAANNALTEAEDEDAVFKQTFTKEDFFSGLPGVYVNSTVSEPAGIEELNFNVIEISEVAMIGESDKHLKAITKLDQDWYTAPEYSWSVAYPIVDVVPDAVDSSKATLSIDQNNIQTGTSLLRVEDLDNGYFRDIDINVDWFQIYPIAYYAFNGNAKDETGNGYDGEASGATLTDDRFGNKDSAYFFDGKDDYIALNMFYGPENGSISQETVDQITVCAWIRADNLQIHERHSIVAFDASDYWRLQIKNSKLNFTVNNTLESRPEPERAINLESETDFPEGEWHFVCGTYRGANVNGTGKNLKLYMDGELVNSVDIGDGQIGTQTTRYGIIGRGSSAETYNGEVMPSAFSFKGGIDEVAIFDIELTAEQISAYYKATK